MTQSQTGARPWYFWPLIALVVGVLLGWLVIGWGLWPVTWTNALPADLKADQQYEYLTMVAESYSATGDLPTAQQRLASFDPDQLGTTLVDLQDYWIDKDARRATEVQNLISALRLRSSQPAAVATAQQETGQAPAATPENQASVVRTLLTSVMWAVLVILALAVFAWLLMKWRKAEGGGGFTISNPFNRVRGRTPGEIIEAEKSRDVAAGRAYPPPVNTSVPLRNSPERESRWTEPWPEPEEVPPSPPAPDPGRTPRPAAEEWPYTPRANTDLRPAPDAPRDMASGPPRSLAPEPAEPSVTSSRPVAPAALDPLSARIAAWVTVYPDEQGLKYYESYFIKDPDPRLSQQEALLGEWSLGVHPSEGGEGGPYAFQLWVNDRRDSDYQVRILVSEGAWRNTALRSQLAGKHEAIQVRPGVEFEVTTANLICRARVEKVSYDERQEPAHGVFSELNLRLIAYRRRA